MQGDLVAVERWFVRRGLPQFIHGYSAWEDVLTRAVPALLLVFVISLVRSVAVAGSFEAAIVAVAVLIGSWVVANRVRGERSFARPRVIGPAELLIFILAPLIPLISGGSASDFLTAFVEILALLVLVYAVTSYGLVAIIRWAFAHLRGQVRSVGSVVTRALPLVLVLQLAVFFGAETWQVAGNLTGGRYWSAIALLTVVGGIVIGSRLPGDIAAIAEFTSWSEVRALIAGTPAAALVGLPEEGNPEVVPLRRRQSVNVGLMAFWSQAVQIILATVIVTLFFALLGAIVIPVETVASWTTNTPRELVVVDLGAQHLVLTLQHIKTASFVSAFAGVSITVFAASDPTYRQAFRLDFSSDLRQALAARTAYLYCVAHRPQTTSDGAVGRDAE